MSLARTKAEKRRNRRAFNAATRAKALKLHTPRSIGVVAAAYLAVDEEDAERDKREAPRQAAKRAQQTPMERYKARREVTTAQYLDADERGDAMTG